MFTRLIVLYIVLFCLSSWAANTKCANTKLGTKIVETSKVAKDEAKKHTTKVDIGRPPQSINVKYKYKNKNETLDSFYKETKIMGGFEPEEEREAPSVVSLFVFDGKEFSHRCGGSICSDNRVITSAYCVREIQISHILILSGSDCLNSDDIKTSVYRVKEITIHENYDYDKSNYDIAILQIMGKFKYGCFTPPAELPLPIVLSPTPVGTICYVYGWGYLKEPDEYPEISPIYFPKCIRKVAVKIIAQDVCQKAYTGVFSSIPDNESSVTDHHLCATGNLLLGGQDVCYGDEGSPLICHTDKGRVLVGVASYGLGCARPNYPGVYTSVFELLPWIAKNGCPLCQHYNDDPSTKKSSAASLKASGHDIGMPVKNEL